MVSPFIPRISEQLNLTARQVGNTIDLLTGGATVPFIARYRKEATSGLDEVQIAAIENEHKRFIDLDKRKFSILESIRSQDKLTAELEKSILETWDLNELEDIYLPYKQKRKTKASVAREKGLEPLAGTLMKQELLEVESFAGRFINDDVSTIEEALSGARDIMAEWINERAYARNILRNLFKRKSVISSKLVKSKEKEAEKYRDYFSFSEPLNRCPGHRFLAMLRGETEGYLRLHILPEDEEAITLLEKIFIKASNESADQVAIAIKDAYKRLLAPSLETEMKNAAKEKADDEAIKVFADNLRQLLLAPPLGQKRLLAIDPGFASGCKVVCLDEYGSLLHNVNIYPHPPRSEQSRAASTIRNLMEAYKLDAIAIGNGTAGRETETFIKTRMPYLKGVEVYIVNEAGASIYSASSIARQEFPNFDVTVRGAVSIGRRLMDPLAELVKIDPKSIGVGQYQHDVDQNKLKDTLEREVVIAVNQVGVNLNTASKSLLSYVSGIGPVLADNILKYREEMDGFNSRKELLKVKGMGPKSYEQSAGFLRIANGENILDNTAVHPESYAIVEKMAKDQGVQTIKLLRNNTVLSQIDLEKYISKEVGIPTLKDILEELQRPGRDMRGQAKAFSFDPKITGINDLRVGMTLTGLVSNITKFGAFVDIGVKQDGLVHISQLADRFVSDPNEVVKLQQEVRVKVLEVDAARKRIQLSMKEIQET